MPTKLSRLGPQERVTAGRYNALVDAVNSLLQVTSTSRMSQTAAGVHHAPISAPRFELIRVSDDLPPRYVDAQGKILTFDPEEDDKWSATEREISSLTDLQESVHLAGERRLCFFSPVAGKWVPVDAVQWHLGVLNDDLYYGDSGTVIIWRHVPGESFTDTGVEITAHDWLLQENHYLPGGARVVVMQLVASRTWVIVSTNMCPIDFTEE